MGFFDNLLDGLETKKRAEKMDEHNARIFEELAIKCPKCGGKAKPSPETGDWYDCSDCGESVQSKPHNLVFVLGVGYLRDARRR